MGVLCQKGYKVFFGRFGEFLDKVLQEIAWCYRWLSILFLGKK